MMAPGVYVFRLWSECNYMEIYIHACKAMIKTRAMTRVTHASHVI